MQRDQDVRPFPIAVDEQALESLRTRLALTRFPDHGNGAGWKYGFDFDYLRELCRYWKDEFDWRAIEDKLNRFDHWSSEIDGETVHFIHQRSPVADAIPLLMLHGWPSSIYEFHKVIEPLTQPVDVGPAFHVVCPSLPGFAWSGPTRSTGWDVRRMAESMRILMSRLGYSRFAVQGTDWGAIIATELSIAHPDLVVGLHLNMLLVRQPEDGTPLSASDLSLVEADRDWLAAEMAYDAVQSTKPDALGPALHDSPSGLAAWIVDKYRSWSDCDGIVESSFTKDELLATVTIFWVTETIVSSMRLYYDYASMKPRFGYDGLRVQAPTACAMFPAEMYHPPRSWVEKRYNVQRWTEMSTGGHFPALEEPTLLVDDIRQFFSEIRQCVDSSNSTGNWRDATSKEDTI